ncbi:MAG: methylase [Nitrosomonas sp.]|nr:MAG: methylase [Nitrosomonas sp.]
MMQIAYSEAAERNKHPILEKLQPLLATCKSVLEIGSGTGQHAVYFAHAIPHLKWQPTELPENLPQLCAQCRQYPSDNLAAPIALDINDVQWPATQPDAVFSANILHIIHWPLVCRFFVQVGKLLPKNGICCTYGPFNLNGRYTSESNAQFDNWLKCRDPESGIRDLADLRCQAEKCGLLLQEDDQMPANNRMIVWRKFSPVEPE